MQEPGQAQNTTRKDGVLPNDALRTMLERAECAQLSELRCSMALGELLRGRLDLAAASELAARPPSVLAQLADDVRSRPWSLASRAEPSPRLSVIVPVFNEEENLPTLYERLTAGLGQLGSYEIILVDDGSQDRSAEIGLQLAGQDNRVKLVELSRNFGHQAALSAGIDRARGDAVVMMDADLQDPPELLREFVTHWESGNQVVYAIRANRKEGWRTRLCYHVFYRLLHGMADISIPVDAGDFCLMDRVVVDALRALPERNRFLRGLRSWVGFKHVGVVYDRPARHAGKAKFSTRHRVRFAIDGLVSFTTFPLRLTSYLGFFTASMGIVYLGIALVARLVIGHIPDGWTSLIAIILILGGAQLCVTGVIGEYLARVYEETKQRPTYVVRAFHGSERR